MTDNSLFLLPTVSKSLLIVLGTFTKSADLWAMESAALWKTKARFPQGLDNEKMLPTLPTAPITTALFFSKLAIVLPTAERAREIKKPRPFCWKFYPLGATPNARTVRARACELGAPTLL